MRRGDKQGDDARAHLAEAERIAARIGECNGMRMHFGPTNIALWRLAVGIELGEGGRAYAEPPGHRRTWPCSTAMAVLNSKDRASTLAFDLARALVQDGAQRDAEAIRHLDTADRLAPSRIRNDPIARDLVLTLDRRARRQAWAGQPAPPLRYPRAGLTPLGTAGSGHRRLWAPPTLTRCQSGWERPSTRHLHEQEPVQKSWVRGLARARRRREAVLDHRRRTTLNAQ